MDRPVSDPDPVTAILEALSRLPPGASSAKVQAEAGLGALSRQMIKRHLARLVREGSVRAEGRTRDRRFWLVGQSQGGDGYPPLSPEGEASRAVLSQPMLLRQPVSYQRAFLDAYRPNETHYLTAEVRAHLARLGQDQAPQRPAGTYARQILQRLLVDLSWNSSRLEGNTYTLLDTERLIVLGESAEGKDAQEAQMILNHKAAIEFMVESAEEIAVDPSTVQNLHALLTENLMLNPMDGGQLRSAPVGIRGTAYVPLAVPQIIEECFRQILMAAREIVDPFEQSFFLLVHLPYLQPFIDGNKRTARLAANLPFIRLNYRPITFMDVSIEAFTDGMLAVYEQNRVALLRDLYVFAYERSCARYAAIQSSLGEPDPFRLRYRSEIKEAVRAVVLGGMTGAEAEKAIQAHAEARMPRESWNRFLAVVETELRSLHEGNFARYRLRPSEFAKWKAKGR